METYYAPAQRAGQKQIEADIATISRNPVMDALLEVLSGLLAILNENRQILAVNKRLMDALGVDDASLVLGLRPGEAVSCIHAHDMPGGCGTSKYCASCGAAIAMVTCQAQDRPVERICAIETQKEGIKKDIYLKVCASPIPLGHRTLILLFLQDVSTEQNLAALERVFFHDISNIVTVLIAATDLLTMEKSRPPEGLGQKIQHLVRRLTREIEIQKCLARSRSCDYTPSMRPMKASQVMAELEKFFTGHPQAEKKHLDMVPPATDAVIKSDFTLVIRILTNMVTNALEAAGEGDTVRVRSVSDKTELRFSVWNPQVIPENERLRIFQRNFSTKPEPGRGLGTFAMKMFGEEVLGGRVGVTSTPEKGTEFCLQLPL